MTHGRPTRNRLFCAGHLLDCALNATYVFMLLFTVCTFVHIPSFTLGFHPPVDQFSLSLLLLIAFGSTLTWHTVMHAFSEPVQELPKHRIVWHPGNRL